MIGGLQKSVNRLAIIAAAGAMSTTGVMAADLGGNCCSDLEERIAELEATTARKGNRRVSLTVSGHVNEGIMWWDDGVNSDTYIVTNVESRTRFRFRGSAKINTDWSAGFYIEIGMSRPGSSFSVTAAADDTPFNAGLDVRHQALWVKSKQLGTVWVGHTSDATDGVSQICLGCSMGNYWGGAVEDLANSFLLRTAAGASSGDTLGAYIFSAEGGRTAVVKYISPTFAGFSLSANYADEEDTATRGDAWGIALRYAGEFGAIRVGAGIGYSESRDGEAEELGGSISVSHTPTGLYVAVGVGEEDDSAAIGLDDRDFWHVSAGINTKLNSLGKTHFGGTYGSFERTSGARDADVWGLTIDQNIDAAAMSIYLQYHNVSASNAANGSLQDFDVVFAGARIKF